VARDFGVSPATVSHWVHHAHGQRLDRVDWSDQPHLTHAQVQMARELGMNPRKLGKLDNHKQEPWKLPLPQFIEELYLRRFGKAAPDEVVSIEDRAKRIAAKKAKRKADRAARRETGESAGEESGS
jgi:hypothetical protein